MTEKLTGFGVVLVTTASETEACQYLPDSFHLSLAGTD